MGVGESDDALVCCVENTVEDRIMESGASFHATYCKEELERFKLRFDKVCLADDKTLDIASVGDVVLKTFFGTSWTLKDDRYIPGLKRRFISVWQLDEEATQMKCDIAIKIRRATRLSEAEISHLWTQFIESENDSIVLEHSLSSENTQSLGGSSNKSEGSKNSGSFEDSGRRDEEYSEDGASSKKGGSETPQMVSLEKNQTYSLVRISARKKASQRFWMFKVKEEHNVRKRYKARLVVKGFQQKRYKARLDVQDSWNEEPCSDVHQVGDERKVKVLRSFNRPPSKLIMEDGVLLERGKVVRSLQRLLEMESSEVISLQVGDC
ncbi:retrovirus-related pol polyprotein from transposon TNT 1-94 [Tanacetum coccineum]